TQRGVGPDQGDDRRGKDDRAGDLGGAQRRGAGHRPSYERVHVVGHGAPSSSPSVGGLADDSCRPDFPAHRERPYRAGRSRRGVAPARPWTGQSALPPDSPCWIRSITEESASVVTSPTSRFSATSRSRRRMILPERVLGSSGTIITWRGLAIAPISLATWVRSSSTISGPPPPASSRRMTNARTA